MSLKNIWNNSEEFIDNKKYENKSYLHTILNYNNMNTNDQINIHTPQKWRQVAENTIMSWSFKPKTKDRAANNEVIEYWGDGIPSISQANENTNIYRTVEDLIAAFEQMCKTYGISKFMKFNIAEVRDKDTGMLKGYQFAEDTRKARCTYVGEYKPRNNKPVWDVRRGCYVEEENE